MGKLENCETNSLGFYKDPKDTKVVVAMSGGVDSSVVAAMLAKEGYNVIGITLQLFNYGNSIKKKGACCAGLDIKDARRVADKFNFPHYVLNYEDQFKKEVIDDFASSYLRGDTPVPCIRCNEKIKFKDLLKTARDLDADCLATGHYIQRKEGKFGPEMHSAKDKEKDQSYFLFATTADQLNFLRFPLGHFKSKTETRILAKELGLKIHEKPDSQDICFVNKGTYADVIKENYPKANIRGDIIDTFGNKLGRHKGIIHYTVGQRRGLGIGGGKPYYVIRLDSEKSQVIVGERKELTTTSIRIKNVNWLGNNSFEKLSSEGIKLKFKVRSTRPPKLGKLWNTGSGDAIIELYENEEGVAPGQACVFYDEINTRVYGGGWIF
ncbi:MAG: tRNA 2-thiouridine(34) synthase MnmA [Rhodobacteraceae bacterium]|jgi:tRNA-specific 2-thiouridylase|nr:MAG: tRNA 2-thiouridine(34) synthase MnmA [Paracoccaceae bacterium]